MIFKLNNLNRSTMELLPDNCRQCGWWQGYDSGWPSENKMLDWASAAESRIDGWGKISILEDRLQGMIQYAPADLFERAWELVGGPPSADAVLITCCLVTDESVASLRKSMLLAALSDLKEQDFNAVEAFCHRDRDTDDGKHLLSHDFLRHCGFNPVRSAGDMVLMRLELSGIERKYATVQKARRSLLARLKKPATSPSPATLCRSHDGDGTNFLIEG